jgi:predicted DNA-binding transcriptional regulator AlpA
MAVKKTPSKTEASKAARPRVIVASAPSSSIDGTQPINPDYFYRLHEARKFFGYGPSTVEEKIRNKELPMPVALSDSGRARGWFGRQILEWQRGRELAPPKPKKAHGGDGQ